MAGGNELRSTALKLLGLRGMCFYAFMAITVWELQSKCMPPKADEASVVGCGIGWFLLIVSSFCAAVPMLGAFALVRRSTSVLTVYTCLALLVAGLVVFFNLDATGRAIKYGRFSMIEVWFVSCAVLSVITPVIVRIAFYRASGSALQPIVGGKVVNAVCASQNKLCDSDCCTAAQALSPTVAAAATAVLIPTVDGGVVPPAQ